jgi:hypothetical protein
MLMVFEPALTRNDWLGVVALGLLLLVLAITAGYLLGAARRKSAVVLASMLGLFSVAGAGVGKLVVDRLNGMCAVEFTDQEAIVRGVGSTVRLPLNGKVDVDLGANGVRLESGGRSALLPNSAQWAVDSLVVDADYLANEFMGRSR